MRNAWTIAKREFAHYFVSPIAYAVALMFLIILGLLFVLNINSMVSQQGSQFGGSSPQATMDFVFSPLGSLILFFTPVLTMRLLSEEQNKGTLELMLTAPLREWELILGKWLGAWFFGLCLIATTGVYALILYAYGKPDPGPIAAGYLGLSLVIGALLALGVFASSLTGNLIVSVAIGYAFVLFIWIVGAASNFVQAMFGGLAATSGSFLVSFVQYLDFSHHYQDTFIRGIINTSDIVYFVSIIVLSLFFATRVVEMRRWQ